MYPIIAGSFQATGETHHVGVAIRTSSGRSSPTSIPRGGTNQLESSRTRRVESCLPLWPIEVVGAAMVARQEVGAGANVVLRFLTEANLLAGSPPPTFLAKNTNVLSGVDTPSAGFTRVNGDGVSAGFVASVVDGHCTRKVVSHYPSHLP